MPAMFSVLRQGSCNNNVCGGRRASLAVTCCCFSENSSVLEWGCFPYLSLYSRGRGCSYIAAVPHSFTSSGRWPHNTGLQFFRFGEGSGNVLCSQTRELQQQCVPCYEPHSSKILKISDNFPWEKQELELVKEELRNDVEVAGNAKTVLKDSLVEVDTERHRVNATHSNQWGYTM